MSGVFNIMNHVNNNTLTLDRANQNLNNRHITQLGPRSLDNNMAYVYPVVDPTITKQIFLNHIKKGYPTLIVEPYNNILYFDHGMCFLKYLQKN
jgi:hypothetical protein